MATVIYLPPTKGIGQSAGEALGAYVSKDIKEKEEQEKAQKLATLFDGITTGGEEGQKVARDAISSGAITDPSDMISLIGQLRKNRSTNTIKIDAFSADGKKTPFALDKNDLTTGVGEEKANALGLTLRNPGKQIDYFSDTPNQRFVGSSSDRIKGNITLDEWKSKYGTAGKAKPTDKDKAIRDYINTRKDTEGQPLQNNSISRKRAREFLYNRSKGIEVINAAFGKKTGADWTIDDPLKNQMAIIAKGQLENFVMNEGLSQEQAGGKAVDFAKEMFREQIDAANAPVKIKEDEGGIIESVKKMFQGRDEKADNATRKSPNYLGDWEGIPIEVPDNISSPLDALNHIIKTYDMSKEDARQFLLDNAPTE